MKNTFDTLNLSSPFVKGRGPLAVRDLKSSASEDLGTSFYKGGIRRGILFFSLFSLFLLFTPFLVSAAILGKPPNNLGLVGYWSLNEGTGTKATDASGGGNTGTLNGDAAWINGKFGKAISLDGTGDYVGMSDTTFPSGAQSFSFALWMKPGGTGTPLYWGTASANQAVLTYYDTSNSKTRFGRWGNDILTPTITQPLNAWSHIAYTYDGATLTAYVNGVSAGSVSATLTTVLSSARIGAAGNDSQYFPGSIDDVRIYSRALTAAQVAALYGSGAVVRKMPNQKNLLGYWSFDENTGTVLGNASGSGSFNGTITGATWTALGKKGSALSFDRTGDYVSLGGIVLTGTDQPFTMSSWVNPANLTDSWKTIMAGGYTGFDVAISGAALQIGRNCGAPGVFYNVYTFPEANRWYHVVAVYDGANINAYVNGVAYTGGAVAYTNLSTYCIGSYNCADELFNGKIDELYLWNRALSASEIVALYTSSNNQKINSSQNSRLTSGLVGLWSFNGGDISNGVALDRSGQGNNGNLINIATSTFYDAGKIGQGFNFDGTDDYVNLGNISALNFERTSPFSVSVWAKTDVTTTDKSLIAKGYYNTGGWGVVNIDTDQIRFFIANSSSNRLIVDMTPSNYYTGIWAHIVFTYDGTSSPSGVKAYVNGQSVSVDTVVDSLSATTQTSTAANIGGAEAGRFYDGMIDEMRVYNRVLTAAEAKQLYDMGR